MISIFMQDSYVVFLEMHCIAKIFKDLQSPRCTSGRGKSAGTFGGRRRGLA